jgi:FtsH-binding integral membrane protein
MEQEQGWDPEVKKFFHKIISSFSFGLLWMMGTMAAGLYYGLAYRKDIPVIGVILFYVVAIATLILLLRYYYRLWRK